MIAILPFIFLTCGERFSPKWLLLVGSTVYSRCLSESRNHQEDVEKVTIVRRKVQPLSIINVLLHSCNTQTEILNTTPLSIIIVQPHSCNTQTETLSRKKLMHRLGLHPGTTCLTLKTTQSSLQFILFLPTSVFPILPRKQQYSHSYDWLFIFDKCFGNCH